MNPNETKTSGTPTDEQTTNLDSLMNQDFLQNTKLNEPVLPNNSGDVISRLNQEQATVIPQQDVSLDKLQVPEQVIQETKVVLGESGIHFNFANRKFQIRYHRIIVISIFLTLFFGLISLFLNLYNRYLMISAQPIIDPSYAAYVNDYQGAQRFLTQTLGISAYQKYATLSLVGPDADQNVTTILKATDLSFIQKKDLLQTQLTKFLPEYIDNKQDVENLKQDVTKYGFFSKELFDLLKNEDYVTSIKDSLVSLEIIKFSSAMKVFSYLDTFISGLGSYLNMPVADVTSKLDAITKRGEQDISVYLNNCYLNPYEVDYSCNLVGDFDRYYTVIQKDQTGSFDRPFFKKLMQYIDIKLEQTQLPSFAITFQNFDPTQKQMSFKVEVNTLKQDEQALTKKGIINPHIFIVTNLLNLIKQSMYVISENIDAKQLKIIPQTIKIGSTVLTVNSSTMNFVLPLQQSTQREITDYTTKDLLSPSP